MLAQRAITLNKRQQEKKKKGQKSNFKQVTIVGDADVLFFRFLHNNTSVFRCLELFEKGSLNILHTEPCVCRTRTQHYMYCTTEYEKPALTRLTTLTLDITYCKYIQKSLRVIDPWEKQFLNRHAFQGRWDETL